MKPRSPTVLPPPGSAARVPALLVPVLAGLAVLQLALPHSSELPFASAVGRVAVPPPPAAPPPVVMPEALRRNPFAPVVGAADAVSADPLGGAVIAGVVTIGHARSAVVALADGRVRYVRIGGVVAAAWRLAALDSSGARLLRGTETVKLRFGQHFDVTVAAPTPKEEEQ